MKVGDIVIVTNLGEMKVYKASPRDLEAEAGLKPENIKLDLINSIDYVESHWRLQDVVTDEAGRFKADVGKMGGNIGERHELEKKLEEDVIKAIAEDIAKIVEENNPEKYFLAAPQNIFKRVWENVESLSSKYPTVKDKLFRYIEEDLTKTDKNRLPEIFKEKGKHF
ncbi:host attachment protein [Nitrosophilus kaiyonis]|uniref:host attachment protein n=1 Tax=Nitrosophilus kaiyonis TaxID=2930200 RepID=UPI002490134E|nr:host attachment protein [Nitrosophilus kaiyonis]